MVQMCTYLFFRIAWIVWSFKQCKSNTASSANVKDPLWWSNHCSRLHERSSYKFSWSMLSNFPAEYLVFGSFHQLMQSRGVRRPSVCLSVCPSLNFFAQVASSTTEVAGSPPDLHTMVPTWACIQGVRKVKVKGHVIRTLF